MANSKNGTLYTGVTSHLIQRNYQHRESLLAGFTKKYGIHSLVWYEVHDTMETAIHREKRIKKYKRNQKIRLIEKSNPEWRDLYETLF